MNQYTAVERAEERNMDKQAAGELVGTLGYQLKGKGENRVLPIPSFVTLMSYSYHVSKRDGAGLECVERGKPVVEDVNGHKMWVSFVVYRNTKTGQETQGLGTQLVDPMDKEGFAPRKALSKARRNAMRGQFDEVDMRIWLAERIKRLSKDGLQPVEVVDVDDEDAPEGAAPEPLPKAQASSPPPPAGSPLLDEAGRERVKRWMEETGTKWTETEFWKRTKKGLAETTAEEAEALMAGAEGAPKTPDAAQSTVDGLISEAGVRELLDLCKANGISWFDVAEPWGKMALAALTGAEAEAVKKWFADGMPKAEPRKTDSPSLDTRALTPDEAQELANYYGPQRSWAENPGAVAGRSLQDANYGDLKAARAALIRAMGKSGMYDEAKVRGACDSWIAAILKDDKPAATIDAARAGLVLNELREAGVPWTSPIDISTLNNATVCTELANIAGRVGRSAEE